MTTTTTTTEGTNHHHHAENDDNVMLLESGFSLSEQAHEQQEESRPSSGISNLLLLPTSSVLAAATATTTGGRSSSVPYRSIEDLRQQVVDDVVGSSSSTTSSNNGSSSDTITTNQQRPEQKMVTTATVVTSPLELRPGQPAQLPLVYCDFTASHRPLQSIEAYLTEHCLPYYGNTHTNTSLTGSQSTAFCSEARQIVGEACGAKTTGKASQDVVLFAGNGTTSAVELLIDCLGLKHHITGMSDHNIANKNDAAINKPVIFVGPYEHHSNLLPWRELGHVDMEMVRLDSTTGNIDLQHLEELLKHYKHRQVKIGAFSAASNVTGVIADDIAITSLLHTYGALSIWDYATGASYLDVQMNPTHPDYDHELIAKDAVLLSGHKLLGGVGTPGVLIIKKHLVSQQNPPNRSGGGTVFYVTDDHHRFLSNRIERFEGGTPNIVGIWRLGLALTAKSQWKKQFQQALMIHDNNKNVQEVTPNNSGSGGGEGGSIRTLLDYDLFRARRIQQQLSDIPNLALMDASYTTTTTTTTTMNKTNSTQQKLPVFSFLIKCGTRFLHYNYVCALLNDIFGIQSRGGCQCAGPFAQYLLGLHGEVNVAVENCLVHTKDELLRPGFTRLSLPTLGTTDAMEQYVITAISWVAEHGWKLMHVYRCNHRTGEWRHKSRPGAPLGKTERKWLSHYRRNVPESTRSEEPSSTAIHAAPPTLEEALSIANRLLELVVQDHSSLMQTVKMSHEADKDSSTLSSLRWYVYPKEVAMYLEQGMDHVPFTMDRTALSGAVRPVAWFPPVVVAPESSRIAALSNKQSDKTAAPAAAAAAAGALINLHFREGDHTGTASVEEIRQGYEDGELTDACQIYQPGNDSWDAISDFLKDPTTRSTPDLTSGMNVPGGEGGSNTRPMLVSEKSNALASSAFVSFKDGEHSGQAPWEDIEAGYEDGELSAACQIYNPESDDWERVDLVVRNRHLSTEPVIALETTKAPPAITLATTLDVPVIEKNEKKKPQRDSASWGHGNMVPIHHPSSTNSAESQLPITRPVGNKQKRHKHIKPPAKLMRLVTQAMIQWDMLEEGDRLLLGLSGGKDSLTLLHVLLEFQKKLPINFEIEVCTIDPMTPSFDPSSLIPYVESLGLKYHYVRDDIVERATNAGSDGAMVSSLCSFCARMKRGHLYSCARKNNCNKLVLAQHLDDLAESFMMSVMHNGFLRTMKANYKINAGDLSVIRPFVYCRESLMTGFAKANGLPVVNENCPACFEEPKERARMKQLLSKEESLYPNFFDNIKRSMLPLMHDDATAILRSYTEEAVAKSRKENQQQRRQQYRRPPTSQPNDDEDTSEEKKEGSFENLHDKEDEVDVPLVLLPPDNMALSEYSDDQLIKELARRRAEKYRLAGAMKRTNDENDDFNGLDDPTGQVCTLNGGNGSIPCRELME